MVDDSGIRYEGQPIYNQPEWLVAADQNSLMEAVMAVLGYQRRVTAPDEQWVGQFRSLYRVASATSGNEQKRADAAEELRRLLGEGIFQSAADVLASYDQGGTGRTAVVVAKDEEVFDLMRKFWPKNVHQAPVKEGWLSSLGLGRKTGRQVEERSIEMLDWERMATDVGSWIQKVEKGDSGLSNTQKTRVDHFRDRVIPTIMKSVAQRIPPGERPQ